MLDMYNVHAVRRGTNVSVFKQDDPAQIALRAMLDRLSEADLAEIEQDLDYLARSGVMSRRICRLLDGAEDRFADVA